MNPSHPSKNRVRKKKKKENCFFFIIKAKKINFPQNLRRKITQIDLFSTIPVSQKIMKSQNFHVINPKLKC